MTLTWFEKLPTADAYRVNGHFAPYAVLARDVRFSDAELMAEYHKLDCRLYQRQFNEVCSGDDYTEESWDRHTEMQNTVYRFATYPHFDETTKE